MFALALDERYRAAVLDIGSNSVRLVVYHTGGRVPLVLFSEKATCRLAEGLSHGNNLLPERMSAALAILGRFRVLLDEMGVQERHVLGTAALRMANNRQTFLEPAEALLGQPIRVLAGEEEARLSALGICCGFAHPVGLVGDLGGGSLELAVLTATGVAQTVSLPVGHRVCLEWLADHEGSIAALADWLQDVLETVDWLPQVVGQPLYAIGGAWRQLAKYHMKRDQYPLKLVHGYTLSAGVLQQLCQPEQWPLRKANPVGDSAKANGKRKKSRAALMERDGQLLVGLLLMGLLAQRVRPTQVVFSRYGLREGCLYEPKARLLFEAAASPSSAKQEARLARNVATNNDPLLDTCGRLAPALGASPPNRLELELFLKDALESIRAKQAVGANKWNRLLPVLCWFADLGVWEGLDGPGRVAFDRMMSLPLPDISHPERVFLALTLFARHTGQIAERWLEPLVLWLGQDAATWALQLGCLLRLAQTLSARQVGVLTRRSVVFTAKGLVVQTDQLQDPWLAGDAVADCLAAVSAAFGQPIQVIELVGDTVPVKP